MVRTEGELDPENGQYVISAIRAQVDASARTERGEHELKGVPERWRLYRVVSESA